MNQRRWNKKSQIERIGQFIETHLNILRGLGLTVLVCIWIAISAYLGTTNRDIQRYFDQAGGITIIVYALDWLNRYRYRSDSKRLLVQLAASRSNDVAIASIDILRESNLISGKKGVLRGKRLSHANLEFARFGWEVNLEETIVTNASLRRVGLQKVNMRKGKASWTSFQGSAMPFSTFDNALLVGADFEGTQLKDSSFQEALLVRARFNNVDMENVNMAKAKLRGASINESHFTDGSLKEADLTKASLQRSNLAGVDFTNAKLKDAVLDGSNLVNAVFYGTDLTDASLKDIRLVSVFEDEQYVAHFDASTILPSGLPYDVTLGLKQLEPFGCIVSTDDSRYTSHFFVETSYVRIIRGSSDS